MAMLQLPFKAVIGHVRVSSRPFPGNRSTRARASQPMISNR
jgi:hypothetical protein